MAARRSVLLVKNLPWTIGSRELQQYFSKFGFVAKHKVYFDYNTGFSKGKGFVQYVDSNIAKTVLSQDDHFLEGRYLDISLKDLPNSEE